MQDNDREGEEKGASKGKIVFWILIGMIPILLLFYGFSFTVDSVGEERFAELRGIINDKMPLWAMILFVYLVESCVVPATPLLVFPMLAEYPWYISVTLTGLAATCGGITAYWMGRALEKIPFVGRMTEKAYHKWGPTIRRYGVGFVWVAALFPLPFSAVCIAAGVMKLPWRKVWPATTTRIIRMAIYYAMFVI